MSRGTHPCIGREYRDPSGIVCRRDAPGDRERASHHRVLPRGGAQPGPWRESPSSGRHRRRIPVRPAPVGPGRRIHRPRGRRGSAGAWPGGRWPRRACCRVPASRQVAPPSLMTVSWCSGTLRLEEPSHGNRGRRATGDGIPGSVHRDQASGRLRWRPVAAIGAPRPSTAARVETWVARTNLPDGGGNAAYLGWPTHASRLQ